MFEHGPTPDAALRMLARLGTRIEYTEANPDGIVDLTKSEVTDDELRHLVFYPGFATLILTQTQVSDAALNFIREMSNLEDLSLHQTQITDDGLEVLRELPKLERLDIGTCPGIIRRGLRPVPAGEVRRNQIANIGLGFLVDLPLRTLSLNHGISYDGSSALSMVPTLRHLAIWRKIENLKQISRFPSLQILLIDDSVGDLSPLWALSQLTNLLLWGNNFSSTEVAKLRLSLPGCRISAYRSDVDAICDFRRWCGLQ